MYVMSKIPMEKAKRIAPIQEDERFATLSNLSFQEFWRSQHHIPLRDLSWLPLESLGSMGPLAERLHMDLPLRMEVFPNLASSMVAGTQCFSPARRMRRLQTLSTLVGA
mmetsp:Transcript_1889/g.4342  ORF Transcript_1889/g.4342 Transcript_1889/m.4342 type:complete len:109 (+) Transcript_1889:73-399(+)